MLRTVSQVLETVQSDVKERVQCLLGTPSELLPTDFDEDSFSHDVRRVVESLVWPFACLIIDKHPAGLGAKEFVRFVSSFSLTTKKILLAWDFLDSHITYIKFCLDTLMCQVLEPPDRRNLPPTPTLPCFSVIPPLFTGYLKTFVIRLRVIKKAQFVYSLSKGAKAAWPAASDLKVARSAFDLINMVVDQDRGPISAALAKSIDSVIMRVFDDLPETDLTSYLPSGSATIQASLRKGGAMCFGTDFVPSQDDFPFPLKSLFTSYEAWRQKNFKERFSSFILKSGDECYSSGKWGGHVNDCVIVPLPEQGGKVRTLTVGTAEQYALQPLQRILLNCWKTSNFSTMRSEGPDERIAQIFRETREFTTHWKSIDYKDATNLLKRSATEACLKSLFRLCGIHYSADIDSPESRHQLPDGAPCSEELEALLRCARISLEKKSRWCVVDDGPVSQFLEPLITDKFGYCPFKNKSSPVHPSFLTEGQMMGNLLSFPLLCVVNLACYWLALSRWIEFKGSQELSEYDRVFFDYLYRHPRMRKDRKAMHQWGLERREIVTRWTLRHRTLRNCVIVNGDDMLFRTTEDFLPFMEEVLVDAGFKESVGKSYFSPDFALINSKLYRTWWEYQSDSYHLRPVEYLHQRFIYGIGGKIEASQARPEAIARDFNLSVSLNPWVRHSMFAVMRRWSKSWTGPFVPNWFLPAHLGGFGLDPGLTSHLRITRAQRKVAGTFLRDVSLQLYKLGKIPLSEFVRRHVIGFIRPWFPNIQDLFSRPESQESLAELDPNDLIVHLFSQYERAAPYAVKREEMLSKDWEKLETYDHWVELLSEVNWVIGMCRMIRHRKVQRYVVKLEQRVGKRDLNELRSRLKSTKTWRRNDAFLDQFDDRSLSRVFFQEYSPHQRPISLPILEGCWEVEYFSAEFPRPEVKGTLGFRFVEEF